ncbi:extracellular solute-binding protein [Nakamurella aerolata]|uniref:Extracellular solute-binding protein n=1 Tax=Nakamurella aerolata TaxID=1656892 RepID=A0A849A430_9ACTN|nr:extracellular solute-binding protein [Nakamurella aerolata]NNG35359.1 extracellular solute-binding protein [Nakamurella aerolata]
MNGSRSHRSTRSARSTRGAVVAAAATTAVAMLLTACGSSTEVSSGTTSTSSTATDGGAAAGAGAAGSGAAAAGSGAAGSGAAAAGSGAAGSGAAAGSAAGSGAAGATGFSCPAGEDTFTFASGGDVNIQDLWQKTLLPAWSKACPNVKITFNFDTHSQNANLDVSKVAAAIKTGKDVPVDLTDNFSNQAAKAGLTEVLTASDVPALSKVSKTALDAVKGAAVPFRGSSVLLAYDSTKIQNPPKTLDELLAWIKANPGKFTYNSPSTGGSGDSFMGTVVASKIAPDVLSKMQTDYDPSLESNFKPGLDILKDLQGSLYQKTNPNGNQAVLDLLAKGEIQLAPVWSDMFLSAQKNKQLPETVKVTQISNPSFTGGAAYMAVIKGTKHKASAAAFVNWLLQPEQQATIVTTIAGFPAIPNADLPASAQGAFDGVETQNLRPGFESKTNSDLQKQWAQAVAG